MDSPYQEMQDNEFSESVICEDLQVYDVFETIHEEYHLISRGNNENHESTSLSSNQWKAFRPTFMRSLARCTWVSFEVTMLVGIICGIITTTVWVLDLNLNNCCYSLQDNWSDIPIKYQRIQLISDVVKGILLQLWSLACVFSVFDWALLTKLNLVIWNILASYTDAIFRLLLYVFGIYGYKWKSYVLNVLFISITFLNHIRIARYYRNQHELNCNAYILAAKLGIQFILGWLVWLPFNYWFTSAFATASTVEKTIMSMSLPILCGVPKMITSYLISRVDKIFSPGRAIIFTIVGQVSYTFASKLIQANNERFWQFVAISLVHSIISILDNLALPLKAKILRCISSEMSTKRPPRVSRLLADETIIKMMTNCTCVVLSCAAVNIISYYYLHKDVTGERYNAHELLIDFIKRAGTAVIIELISNVISLKILSYAYNIPVLRVWQRRKYWILAMHIIQMPFAIIYGAYIDNALMTVQLKARNQTVPCLGPFERF